MPRARSAAPSCWRPRRKSYHGPGTCTFYGTANSNQMLMEIMGLHLPGASFVNPGHAAARRADPRGGEARAGDHRARQRLHAGRRDGRRALDRQRHRRPARHRRLDQPHDPPDRHGAGGRHRARPGRTFADLSDVVPLLARVYPNGARRREPFPRRRRHGLPDPRTARRRPAARGRADRLGRGPRRPIRSKPKLGADGGVDARAGAGDERRREGAGAGREAVPADRRAEAADRQSRPRRDQDLGGEAGAPRRSRRRRSSSTARRRCTTPSRPASSTATSSPSSASRGRRPTACRNCTS